MSMERIRERYGVPAKRGGRVRYWAEDGACFDGTITSATKGPQYIRVKFDVEEVFGPHPMPMHPTYGLEYLPDEKHEYAYLITGEKPDGVIKRRRFFTLLAAERCREVWSEEQPTEDGALPVLKNIKIIKSKPIEWEE